LRYLIPAEDVDQVELLGPADMNLTTIGRFYRTYIVYRDGLLRLSGPRSEKPELQQLFDRLLARCRRGERITPELIEAEIRRLREEKGTLSPEASRLLEKTAAIPPDVTVIHTPRKTIIPKSDNQRRYLEAINENDIVFAIGPAGTGKTYLAVAVAVNALIAGRASRIILTRPAVEAGESLGYLPGTFKEKIDPYLRPLYDALFDMLPLERTQRLIEQEVIEVAPLAFMRGRTLSDAYIILDEAQNTTSTQMKMFLTRLGWNSKAIITGDITQIDLAEKYRSGLVEAEKLLAGITGISIVHFDKTDVVRPPLVSRIIHAYEDKKESEPPAPE
jgi:phosphate starvation-inducible PhoH-like protein